MRERERERERESVANEKHKENKRKREPVKKCSEVKGKIDVWGGFFRCFVIVA